MLLDSPVCDSGWKIPNFTLMTPSGESLALKEAFGARGLLVGFICNHCPYVKAIADRFSEDARALIAEGINVIAINSNDYDAYPADSPQNMLSFSTQHNFSFPYLIDETQAVAKAFNAVCTPDFFGFNRDGELQYRGRLDDAAMGEASNRKTELLEAMRMIAATGYGPSKQTPSMGCSIKWRTTTVT